MGEESMEKSWHQRLMETAEVIHLATLKEDGAPTLRPVNFLYWDGKVYVHTGPKSGKIAQIRRDPRVCLEIEQIIKYVPAKDNPCTATYSCRSIVAEGEARLVAGKEKKCEILQKMMEKYQPEGGFRPLSIDDTEIVAIIEIEIKDLSVYEHLRA